MPGIFVVRWLAIGLLVVAFVSHAPSVGIAATRVDLVLNDPSAGRTVAWPITTGVPFPRGALTDAEHCRLIDDKGAEQLLQAKVAATWNAERSSVRWLTIDFIAQPGRKYALEFGPDVQRKLMSSSLKVANGEPLQISTGALTAEFSAKTPAALGRIAVDLDGDGRIEPNEAVASGGHAGDHVIIDQEGRRYSSERDGADRRIVVESTGPVRACIRVDGFYTGPDGRRIVGYRTRYHFFTGLGLVKAIDEFRVIGSTKETRFKDIALVLDLPLETAGRTVAVDASGEPGNQTVSTTWEKETKSIASFQHTYRHYGNPECQGAVVESRGSGEKATERNLAQNERVGEWMQVADPRAAVTGSLRWFWQQFPKEWEATPKQLVMHLWSPRGSELDFGPEGVRKFIGPVGQKYVLDWQGTREPRTPIEKFFYFAARRGMENGDVDGLGTNKHHEVFFHFAPSRQAAAGEEYGRLAAEQPLALASGEWNCSTDVFGPLLPRPNNSPYEAIVDRLFDLSRYAQDAFGDYGWWLFGAGPHYSYQWDAETKRHYADPRRFEYHTYQKETQLWWCYLRSGERKFFDWALPSENHWVDIAVSHAPTTFETEWLGGQPKTQRLNWPRGDWAIDSPVHHLRHHNTGEAWLRGASQFWASYHRTLETTTLAYYLTGDERFNDVIEYWREYFGDLAGKISNVSSSDSIDFRRWHQEQAWYRPTPVREKHKTWVEMIRDYAPFWSGSRHQQTMFFNVSTLYEHTWDPKIGRAMRECAAAFIDPDHRIGVWRCQDNELPANADAPTLMHFWTPALWKYARVSRDPRMPEVFRRYFDACYAADPYREDLGAYSNVQLGYAWYFTHDPKHLRPILNELNYLTPNAAPLAKPEDLGGRIYNPHHLIRSLAATPRLAWALEDAKRRGISLPPPAPLRPQRTAIALVKQLDVTLRATLWSFDRAPRLIDPDGKAYPLKLETQQHSSPLQPFDRTMPKFEVFLHTFSIAAQAPSGVYILSPELETGILELSSATSPLCNAALPIAMQPADRWFLKVPEGVSELRLESAAAATLRVKGPDGVDLPTSVKANVATVAIDSSTAGGVYRIETTSLAPIWFRIDSQPAEQCWVALDEPAVQNAPNARQTAAAVRPVAPPDLSEVFVDGRFGKALQVAPGRELHIADHLIKEGQTRRLFDEKQGTIEFWIKRQWDERLAVAPRVTFVSNGLLQVWSPWKLPLNEWTHLAVVWRPYKHDPKLTAVHFYVNGLDEGNYRSVKWEGYGDVPPRLFGPGKLLEEFVIQAPPGTSFVIDDLRISSSPRYADLNVDFGGQQVFNPVRFTPSTEPAVLDEPTEVLLRFDGNLQGQADGGRTQIEGRLGANRPK
jgi:hypothetical protein